MTNRKALAAIERTALFNTLVENPELTAMTAICEILQELPDEASRMRVMHWAFGRFSPEFKRGAIGSAVAPAQPIVSAAQPVAAVAAPIAAPVAVPAPPPAPLHIVVSREEDLQREISELEELFPPAPRPAYVGF